MATANEPQTHPNAQADGHGVHCLQCGAPLGASQYSPDDISSYCSFECYATRDRLQDTPASNLRNALQILVLAGPNWVRPVDAFAVRERIEAALSQMEGAR